MKTVAVLPCRCNGTRLYGKPLQYLDIEQRVTILEHQIKYLLETKVLDGICLAISEEPENYGFIRIAEKLGISHIFGDPLDVLGRMIKAIHHSDATTVVLVSTENPFIYTESFQELHEKHIKGGYDFSMISSLPEGAAISIIKASALVTSHKYGAFRHRSELVTSYIFDHKERFKLNIEEPSDDLRRSDVRITVDYPEDLVYCRQIYQALGGRERLIRVQEIIKFWDKFAELRKPVENIGIDWGHGRIWE